MKGRYLYINMCLIALLVIMATVRVSAQVPFLNATYSSIKKWEPAATADSVFLWSFGFGEDSSQTALALRVLRSQYVHRIQLVYTRYAREKGFDQHALNNLRLQKLAALHPEWFDRDANIRWEFIEQTGCASGKGCADYFHGFAIYYMSRARAGALYRRELLRPRDSLQRASEIADFYYWFDREINPDQAFTTILHKEHEDEKTDDKSIHRAETRGEEVRRVEDMKKVAMQPHTEAPEVKPQAMTGKAKRPEPSKDARPTAKDDTPKDVRTKETPPSEPEKATVAKETAEVKLRGEEPKKEQKSDSRVHMLYLAAAYPKEAVKGTKKLPAWAQYTMQLLSERKEWDDSYILRVGWGDSCQGKCDVCIPPPLRADTPECIDCILRPRGTREPYIYDGTVQEVLDRIYPGYKKMNVTSDVTLGMMSIIIELMRWTRARDHASGIHQALFYNDGDATPNEQKKIGSTGGLYPRVVFDFTVTDEHTLFRAQDRLYATACHAARAGAGGDAAENALEACREAQQRCPTCDVQILIADNRSPVRDMALLSEIRYPLRIILPFVVREGGLIHTDYLDIARRTHGSIHIKTTDYYDLDKMKEGQVLSVLKYRYMLVRDHFVCVGLPAQ